MTDTRSLSRSLAPEPVVQLLSSYKRRGNPVYQFWMGIRFLGAGWTLWLATPSLQLTSVVPILLSLAFFGGLIYLGTTGMDQWLSGVIAGLPDGLEGVARALGSGLVALVLLVLTYLLFFPVISVVAAPFRARLSEQTEQLLRGEVASQPRPLWSEIAIGLVDTLAMLGLLLTVSLLLLGMGIWLPGVGGIPVILVSVCFAALDCVDPPLSRRSWRLGQKLGFLGSHLALLGGFGLATYVLLTLPGINLVTLPVATIGGTLLSLAVLTEEAEQAA